MFKFIFECWRNVFLVHALEKWRLQMMLARKKYIWKRKEISLLLLLSFLNPKISFFIGKGWVGSVCAGRDVTQEGSREQTWQCMMVGGRGVGASKKAILAWRNYWITPKVYLSWTLNFFLSFSIFFSCWVSLV